MTKIKVITEHKDETTFIPLEWINDNRLSFAERGVLIYLMSLPHDAKINVSDVAEHGRVAYKTALRMLKRLAELEYINDVVEAE